MLRTWLAAGMLVTGLAIVGCDDGSHEDDGNLSGSGDNLKGRDKEKETKPVSKGDAAAPATDAPQKDAGSFASQCAVLLCPTGTQCIVKEVQCIRAPCPPIASCEPIDQPAPTTCAVTLCKQGTVCVEDDKGAHCVEPTTPGCAAVLCAAGSTCEETPNGGVCVEQKCTAKCSAGQHCELQEVVCIKAPCLPVPTCVDDVVDGCATVKCKAGYHCESTQPQCFTTPCPPITGCVPN